MKREQSAKPKDFDGSIPFKRKDQTKEALYSALVDAHTEQPHQNGRDHIEKTHVDHNGEKATHQSLLFSLLARHLTEPHQVKEETL